MATYYHVTNREESNTVPRTTAANDPHTEYSIKFDDGQWEIPEKYIKALTKVEMISNVVDAYMELSEDKKVPCSMLLFLLGRRNTVED